MNIELQRPTLPDRPNRGEHKKGQKEASRAIFWLQGFILFQIFCQLVLLTSYVGAAKPLVRAASFAASAALVILPGKGALHPVSSWLVAALMIATLGLAHPTTNSTLSGLAQVVLYFTIVAPVFWVSRFTITPAVLKRVLLVYWGFQSLSAIFGVLQVYYPGSFQPTVAASILNDPFFNKYLITLANGEQTLRPMGLTDLPGGAARAGLYAFLFGLGFFFYFKEWVGRGCGVASMGLGLFCIYLSQIRSTLIMAGIATMVFGFVSLRRGDMGRLTLLLILAPCVLVVSYMWAISIGGKYTEDRFATLTSESATTVYQKNRGAFLEETINEVAPKYPLGAGLGRWGMMNAYFGDQSNPQSTPLWAEMIWTGWVYDGGIPLAFAYGGALAITCLVAWRIAVSRLPGEAPYWGMVVLSYNLSVVASSFNCNLLASTMGMDFWLLNAVLFGAAVYAHKQARRKAPHNPNS